MPSGQYNDQKERETLRKQEGEKRDREETYANSVFVVFLWCPLIKKHADLSGSFLYSQSMMNDVYSKPTNRTELSIPMKTKALRSHSI